MADSRVDVLVHLVWGTWNRWPMIEPAWEPDLHHFLHRACADLHCRVVASGGTADHVHLLVSLAPTVPLARLLHDVKGASSRFVGQHHAGDRVFRWQGGYGAFSVDPASRKRVISYIRGQKHHHASGDIWPEFEAAASVHVSGA